MILKAKHKKELKEIMNKLYTAGGGPKAHLAQHTAHRISAET